MTKLGIVESTNPYRPGTWYSTDRYDDPNDAQEKLALKRLPTHRIGPIRFDELGNVVHSLRIVAPAYGFSGGGIEICVKDPVYLPGLWSFSPPGWTPMLEELP